MKSKFKVGDMVEIVNNGKTLKVREAYHTVTLKLKVGGGSERRYGAWIYRLQDSFVDWNANDLKHTDPQHKFKILEKIYDKR